MLIFSVIFVGNLISPLSPLIHEEAFVMSCSKKEPVYYESFILTVNEGLRLSCAVCFNCENENATECQEPDFSLPSEEIEPKTFSQKYREMKRKQKKFINETKLHVINTGKEALADIRFKDENKQENLDFAFDSGLLGENLPKIFFTKTQPNGLVNIVENSPTIFMVQDLLIFKRTAVSHTGVYDCFWRGRKRKSWSVTVWDAGREPFREIYENDTVAEEKYNRKLRDLHLPKANLHIFSRWTAWSECNICSIRERKEIMMGVKLRAGYCYIKKINLIQSTRPKNSVDLINFKNGLPCRSHLIPTEIRGLKAVAFRPSELEIGKCLVYCMKKYYYKAVFNLSGQILSEYRYRTGLESMNVFIDYNDGTFIRKVNNTEEDMQTDPDKDVEEVEGLNNYKLRPPRTGDSRYEVGRDDYKIKITCPFTGSVTGAFMWFELFKKPKTSLNELIQDPFDFLNIFHKTRGRIKFDPGYNIIISSILPSDNYKMYVCLHENKIIGTVNIVYANKAESDRTVHMLSQLALLLMPTILIVITLIFIFFTLRSKVIKEKKTKVKDME